MLEAVYVDTVDEKAIMAIRPKPAFMPIFEVANTRMGSKVVLINEPPWLTMSLRRLIRVSVGDGGGSAVHYLQTPLVLRLQGKR